MRDWSTVQHRAHAAKRRAACARGLLLVVALVTSGCGGCRRASSPEDRDKEPPKPDFELANSRILPGDRDELGMVVKPGHWSAAWSLAVANHFDFRGELVYGRMPLSDGGYRVGFKRDALLSKGQEKLLDTPWILPVRPPPEQQTLRETVDARVGLFARSGRAVLSRQQQLVLMPAHQFFFVVLSARPEEYGFLETLASVRAPSGEFVSEGDDAHYRVIPVMGEGRVPLDDELLGLTSIAYMLWDGFDAERLDAGQQQAILDWLHWGGQLIVSGPASLDALATGFLAPYLPARSGGTWQVGAGELAQLNRDWARADAHLAPAEPFSGVRLDLSDEARVLVDSSPGALVAERRVGRGRICVTAFSLTQREFRAWSRLDGFVNGCLLRRPPRKFKRVSEGTVADPHIAVQWWLGYKVSRVGMPETYDEFRHDARLTSQLRIFSRDAGRAPQGRLDHSAWHRWGVRRETREVLNEGLHDENYVNFGMPDSIFVDVPVGRGAGVCGWDDYSETSAAARTALFRAAGIEIPSAAFVLRILGIYLVVLVPVNWLLFRLVGRIELAWAAVPVVATVFAVIVVRMAQLDIGFVRAENEIAVVELHGGYPRAHVTRYRSLYTSLATTYDVHVDHGGVALPFRSGKPGEPSDGDPGVTLIAGADRVLSGVNVPSNSVQLLHAEQMVPLDGAITLARDDAGKYVVANHTGLNLDGVGVAGPDGAAFMGALPSGGEHSVQLAAAVEEPLWREEYAGYEQARWLGFGASDAAQEAASGSLNVSELLDLAAKSRRPGAWMLVGWTADPIAGTTVSPRAEQSRSLSMVVVHLESAPLAAPAGDHVWEDELLRQVVEDRESDRGDQKAGADDQQREADAP